MPIFATKTGLPRYLRAERDKIEAIAKSYGLDFFPTVFEMLSYEQMNEIAAYGGFPNRYPHWRFGMEFEQLSKSYEYGLSKIYEMVINNNPAFAYLLEGNSLTDQKLVMCHVYAHVDFFKNNFAFRSTDLDAYGPLVDARLGGGASYQPDRRWVDKMANHGSLIRRLVERHGIDQVEEYVDTCLSLENLVDPWSRWLVRERGVEEDEVAGDIEVPRLKAKEYMQGFINPAEYLDEQREKIRAERAAQKARFPRSPQRDVLLFLIENAPLQKWERSILNVIRDEAYYFLPQMRTKIMNEGWASYFHSRLMTEQVCGADEIVEYAENNAGVMATGSGRLNPYKLGVELFRSIEERWNRGQFGREWEECTDLDAKRNWNLRLGLGRSKIFEVRALHTDVTFIDEFLTVDFAREQKLFTFEWSGKGNRFEIESREFAKVKQKLLAQLTNFGSPEISVVDANHQNRGELLLKHDHRGVDLREDYARDTMAALVRVWKRPVSLMTIAQGKELILNHDGREFSIDHGSH